MTQEEWVKIEIFLPPESLDEMRQALNDAGAGHIGKYDHCLSVLPVRGYWRPLPEANPYAGQIGEVMLGDEVKIEVKCPRARVAPVLAAIRAHHPYEEPVINIIPLLDHLFETGR
jgi:hypothetical protein